MTATLFIASGMLCIVTALVHSIVGERKLIGPLLASDVPVLKTNLARQVLRFAWHWTSVLWLLVAYPLVSAGTGSFVDRRILMAIALAHIAVGLFDAVYTRGRHIGWPLITLIGVLTLFALNTTQ